MHEVCMSVGSAATVRTAVHIVTFTDLTYIYILHGLLTGGEAVDMEI